jgi:hypothetical protein
LAPGVAAGELAAIDRRAWWLPSLSDCLFVALLAWLFVAGNGWQALLADGDTGWHIRTGESVLDEHRLPRRDPYSFSRPGEPWYAWEWLADVLFAAVHRAAGLKGVVLVSGVLVAAYLTLLFRDMLGRGADLLGRGADLLVGLAVCLLGAGASGVHFLARPHLFTLLLLALSLWLADRGGARVWVLVPLAAVWANLHAGFAALPVCLGLNAPGRAAEAAWEGLSLQGSWLRVRRLVLLSAACTAATLVNAYGLDLHRHILGYLRSDWIRDAVDEFQSPKFRGESALHFEVLLFAGLALAYSLARRRRLAEALLVVFWAHAALVSARHVPVYVVVAGPIVGLETSRLWREWAGGRARGSFPRTLLQLSEDLSARSRRTSAWAPATVAALIAAGPAIEWPRDFPEQKFPVRVAARQQGHLAGARVFTSDQ